MCYKKSFNILSLVGLFIFFSCYLLNKLKKTVNAYSFLRYSNYLIFVVAFLASLILLSNGGSLFDISSYLYFVIVLFALPVLELVLNSLGFFHPRKNLIFFLYILFAILDSHFESRVKTFVSLFKETY